MSIDLIQSESIVDLVNRRIEKIANRIRFIESIYYQISNKILKERLISEFENLKINFREIKNIILILENSSKENIGISKLLVEKYYRFEKEIFKYNFLFPA